MNNYLIYTIVTEWNEPPRARHQLAYEFKKDGVVYFVEKNKTGLPRLEIKKVEENVFVLTPFFPVDYRIRYRTPIINRVYQSWLLKRIRKLNVPFEIVITFDYTAPEINKFFNNVLFYCADDNVGFGNFNPTFINNYHNKTERKVAEGCKLCVVTSDYMFDKIKAYNPKTFNIPLGSPEINLKVITTRDKKGASPHLGLVGYLDSNLDDTLLDQLLHKYKITFIGPASNETKARMKAYPNATLLGPKTGDDLYKELQKVDVCIAPYDIKKVNKGATPNKLWLYLAVGRPCVITKIPNIRSWIFENDLVYICDNKDFEEKCLLAFQQDNQFLTLKRIETAKQSSWYNRVQQIKELFYRT